ncbi:putative ribonuclease H-like domain-containing protein, partial [Tanacetum coccineum]
LFGPVSVRSINRKSYCLVVTDDFSRFSWVFFLATKDKTPEILKNFITGIKNQSDSSWVEAMQEELLQFSRFKLGRSNARGIAAI